MILTVDFVYIVDIVYLGAFQLAYSYLFLSLWLFLCHSCHFEEVVIGYLGLYFVVGIGYQPSRTVGFDCFLVVIANRLFRRKYWKICLFL